MVRRLLAAILVSTLAPVAVVATRAVAAPPACPADASDAGAAASLARACGGRVEVAAARTEQRQVFANPDGTATIEEHAHPQWARGADGRWSTVDPTLVANPDGSYSPRASTVDLVFSGGGTGALLTGRRAGKSVSLSWPDRLPKPTVSGPSATYAEVLPGVDLVVTAQVAGFSEVLVVKSRVAAANPALRRLGFGTTTAGLRWRAVNGELTAVDDAGSPVFASSAPRMWDSSPAAPALRDGGRAKGDVSGPAAGARSAPIALTIEGGSISLAPDRDMLDAPDLVFPLYLDPTIGYSGWTMINSQFPNQSYWSFDKTDCPSPFTGECAKVGRAYGESMIYRSLFQFSTDAFRGKQILDANFSIDLLYSAYPAASWTELWQVNAGIGAGTTWSNNTVAWASGTAAVQNFSKPAARKPTEFTGALASQLQAMTGSTATFGLRSNPESNDRGWKKFDARTARLVVTTNTIPATPDQLTVDGKACAAGAGRPFVATATPTLRARGVDADGDSLDMWFTYATWNGSAFVDQGSGHQMPFPSGGTAQWTTPSLVDGGIHTFRAQVNDAPSHPGTGYGTSPNTHLPGNCEWQVDLVDPAMPVVTSALYPENCAICGGIGQTGRFTLTSSADVVAYKWGTTDPPTNVLNAPSVGAPVIFDWTPAIGGARTLHFQAVDRAGRTKTKVYQFFVGPPTPSVGRWLLDDSASATTVADASGNAHPGTVTGGQLGVPGRIVPGLDGVSRTAMQFTGGTSGVSLPGGIVDTASSYSVSAWVKLDDTTAPRTVVSIAGTDHALFTMGYSPSAGRWSVETTSAAGPTYTTSAAVSDAAPTLGVWTHLTGVYIASFRELHFYVNGVKQVSQRNNIGTWAATGPLTIGRTASATASNPMAGTVSDVQVWNRQMTGPEIAQLFDPLLVGRVGEWHMDEVGPGPAFDFSGLAHDLSFLGGASIPPVAGGHAGTALWLNGYPQTAATDGSVVHTDQSFTVSAWVKMTDADPGTPAPDLPTSNMAVLSQNGTYVGGFYLGYKVIGGSPRWVFGMKNVDSDNGPWSEAISATALTTADIGRWVHIVGVYDAANAALKLSVNGALAGTAARTGRWDAAGEFLIGSARFTNPDAAPQQINWWIGYIDEVRVYAGAVADVTRIP